MRRIHLILGLTVLALCAAVVEHQVHGDPPVRGEVACVPCQEETDAEGGLAEPMGVAPVNFCVCCYYKFFDFGSFCGFYAGDCVNNQWIAYFGPCDTPLSSSMCTADCPADCLTSVIPSPSAALEPMLPPTPDPNRMIFVGSGNGVHARVRRDGLVQALPPGESLKLLDDPHDQFKGKVLDECWGKVTLPGGGIIPVKFCQVAVRRNLNKSAVEVGGPKTQSNILGIGWEVSRIPPSVSKDSIIEVDAGRVLPVVPPDGTKTRCLWVKLLAGDFQVATSTEVEVPSAP